MGAVKIIGLDPGLRRTGWGIVAVDGPRLYHVADGAVATNGAAPLVARLASLHHDLARVIESYGPDEAAVEETFVNRNPASTLSLGMARGVVLLAPAEAGLPVTEYAPNQIKKAIVGRGHADKTQVQHMVRLLLGGARVSGADAADALAVAICHAHHARIAHRWRSGIGAAEPRP